LLQQRARDAGDTREPQAIIADLDEVSECLLVYLPADGAKGRPRALSTLEERSDT